MSKSVYVWGWTPKHTLSLGNREEDSDIDNNSNDDVVWACRAAVIMVSAIKIYWWWPLWNGYFFCMICRLYFYPHHNWKRNRVWVVLKIRSCCFRASDWGSFYSEPGTWTAIIWGNLLFKHHTSTCLNNKGKDSVTSTCGQYPGPWKSFKHYIFVLQLHCTEYL